MSRRKPRLSPEGYPILAGKPPPPEPEQEPTLAAAIRLVKSAQVTMTHGSSYGWRTELKLQLAELTRLLERLASKGSSS